MDKLISEEDESISEKTDSRLFLRASWRSVAFGAMIVASAFFVAIVVIANTSGANALSAIALVLAILAFVIQIVVFISDGFNSAQRDRETSAINANTQSLLAKIEEKTNTTNELLNQQLTKMLDRFIFNVEKSVEADEVSDGASAEDQKMILLNSFRKAADEVRTELNTKVEVKDLTDVGPSNRVLLKQNLPRWPSENICRRLASDGLGEIDDASTGVLKVLAKDLKKSFNTNMPDGLGFYTAEEKRSLSFLLDEGFVKSFGATIPDVFQLTGKGRAAARLFTAEGEMPPYVDEIFPWVRLARS